MLSRFTRYWFLIFAASIIALAAFIRFFQLGSVPHGMAWDEAAIGYNGYAVIVQRRDEWLDVLPISFRSFGDYKAPFAIYLVGLFEVVFGLKLWVVRLPFALASLLAIIAWMALVRLLTMQKPDWDKPQPEWPFLSVSQIYSLLAGLLLTLSPWHVHYSRVAFESGMALAFVITGIFFLYHLAAERKLFVLPDRVARFEPVLAAGFLSLSLYTYHSAKIVAPLLAAGVVWSFRQQLSKLWRTFAAVVAISGLLLLPLAYDTLLGAGGERFNQATLFSKGLSPMELVSTIASNFASHFSLAFLISGETATLRHGDGRWGVLLPTTLLFIVVAVISWVRKLYRKDTSNSRTHDLYIFSVVWLVLGVLPAALGQDVPHSNRALLALPGFLGLAMLGISASYNWVRATALNRRIFGSHGEKNSVLYAVVGTVVLVHAATFIAYQGHYYQKFAGASAEAFSDGYLDVFAAVAPYEKGTDGREVNQIIFTTRYQHPYVYALFARKTKPISYHQGSLVKYMFTDQINEGTLLRANTLIVAHPDDPLPEDKVLQRIYGSDGSVRFKLFLTDPE